MLLPPSLLHVNAYAIFGILKQFDIPWAYGLPVLFQYTYRISRILYMFFFGVYGNILSPNLM